MSGEIFIRAGYELPGNTPVTIAMLNKIAPGLVAQIQANAVTGREIADGSIPASKLDANIAAQLGVAPGSVGTAQLASNAVATGNVADGAITRVKIEAAQQLRTGMMFLFPGTTLAGALRCEGQAVSRTTYADLFALYNAMTPALPFGAGDGSTTFNVPDQQGGVIYIAGTPAANGTAKVIGTQYGNDSHAHTQGSLAATAMALLMTHLPSVMRLVGLQLSAFSYSAGGQGPPAIAGPNYIDFTNPGGSQAHGHAITGTTDPASSLSRGQCVGYLFVQT